MTQGERYDLIQDHFDYLDQIASSKQNQGMERGPSVMQFSQLDRDLYFVHDVLWIANNAGIETWIQYHSEDDGWIDDAARAYRAIGHEAAAQGILEARDFYRTDPDSCGCRTFNEHIVGQEDAISTSLHAHLSRHQFTFHSPADIRVF